jgi:hypothetical protein
VGRLNAALLAVAIHFGARHIITALTASALTSGIVVISRYLEDAVTMKMRLESSALTLRKR